METFDPVALATSMVTEVSGALTGVATPAIGLAAGLLALSFGIRFIRKYVKA